MLSARPPLATVYLLARRVVLSRPMRLALGVASSQFPRALPLRRHKYGRAHFQIQARRQVREVSYRSLPEVPELSPPTRFARPAGADARAAFARKRNYVAYEAGASVADRACFAYSLFRHLAFSFSGSDDISVANITRALSTLLCPKSDNVLQLPSVASDPILARSFSSSLII